MGLQMTLLDTPPEVSAMLGWDPATNVHDRRRAIAKALIAKRIGCEPQDISIEREDPRGFGYHTRLLASKDGAQLPFAIATASYRSATVVAICDPSMPLGIDIRDNHPDPVDLRTMIRHSRLFADASTDDILHHWVCVQAVLEADGRGVRVAPDHVKLDSTRSTGWLRDHKMRYRLVDASRDGWIITIASGILNE